MKLLVTGADGQVGWELMRSLQVLGEVVGIDLRDIDLRDSAALAEFIRDLRPSVVVNAAAYTAVDKAEDEPEMARAINEIAPGVLATEAARLGALVVHYSTDYVFDGSKQEPYVEDDVPNPLSVYGATKLAGETAIDNSGASAIILRTSWVYTSRGHNFLKSILRLAGEREELRIVDDQVGAPTTARVIADATAHIVWQSLASHAWPEQGVRRYNLVCGGQASWFDFAVAIVELARRYPELGPLAVRDIAPIPTSEYPTPAQRPLNSRLSTKKLRDEFGLALPDWRVALDRCVEDLVRDSATL